MNFFKSILADDSDSPEPESDRESEQRSPSRQDANPEETEEDDDDRNFQSKDDLNSSSSPTTANSSAGGWSFGGLMKTLASRSESVLETYRRDLEEFGSGLKKETDLIRDVASRAVKELPDVGASVAHVSLGSVSKTIDGVFKSTAEIISQGKDSLLHAPYEAAAEPVTPDASRNLDSRRYSRFDAQLTTIQNDPNTFSEEPEDFEDYTKWKSEFNLNDKRDEFVNLIAENSTLEGVYKRLVPTGVVDEETFWCRYFYRVHKLKQQESVRAKLVKRAISVDEEEVLSWDVDDDDEDANHEETSSAKLTIDEQGSNEQAGIDNDQDSSKIAEPVIKANNDESRDVSAVIVDEKRQTEANADSSPEKTTIKSSVVESSGDINLPEEKAEESLEVAKDASALVMSVEGESDQGASGKRNGNSSLQEEDEDFGWDEIEDIESGDDKKMSSRVQSANRDEVRKRLAEEDDENLSWEIEDDDEPAKA
ncbi:unnamed protein product [Cuscuta epithymum]|uniref:BSD domain-containing protein n=1 Tax=Cuscuta epithymum TaxID=186058 RepID=A0AAV0DXE8_9ASTE|nr:unnamed protein product [Cuscuta epithymum]